MTHPEHAEVHCGNTGIDSTQSKKYIQKVDNKPKGQCTVIAITYPDTFLEQSGSHAMLTLASVRTHSRSLLVNTPLLSLRTCVLIQPEPPVGSLNQATE